MSENTKTNESSADDEVNSNTEVKNSKLDIMLALAVGFTTGAMAAIIALDIAGCIRDPK